MRKGDDDEERKSQDIGINTDVPVEERETIEQLERRIATLEREIKELKESDPGIHFSLESIADDDGKVAFYTGFPTYKHLKICFDFLGPAANQLIYRDSRSLGSQ